MVYLADQEPELFESKVYPVFESFYWLIQQYDFNKGFNLHCGFFLLKENFPSLIL